MISKFEERDGRPFIGAPDGDGGVITCEMEADTITPYNDWTGWAWTLACVNDAGANQFTITETLTSPGQITDNCTAALLSLSILFTPAAFASLAIGYPYTWGLRGTKATFVETIVPNGLLVIEKGIF